MNNFISTLIMDPSSKPFILKIMASQLLWKNPDDDISRRIELTEKTIVIITEDLELCQRCKQAVAPTRLSKKKDRSSIEQRFICHLIC